MERRGSKHKECFVSDIVIDEERKIITTPAYMEAKNISETAEGIEKLVSTTISMVT